MAVHGTAVFVTLACVLVAVSAQQCGRQAIQPVIPIRGSANDRIIGGTDVRISTTFHTLNDEHKRKLF